MSTTTIATPRRWNYNNNNYYYYYCTEELLLLFINRYRELLLGK